MQPQNIPSTGYLRQAQLIGHILPIGATTLWRWVNAGKFPKPIKLSARVTAWRAEDVRAWIEAQGKQVAA
jgi:predicted DNA-binding transcriptional regulator AlpA